MVRRWCGLCRSGRSVTGAPDAGCWKRSGVPARARQAQDRMRRIVRTSSIVKWPARMIAVDTSALMAIVLDEATALRMTLPRNTLALCSSSATISRRRISSRPSDELMNMAPLVKWDRAIHQRRETRGWHLVSFRIQTASKRGTGSPPTTTPRSLHHRSGTSQQ